MYVFGHFGWYGNQFLKFLEMSENSDYFRSLGKVKAVVPDTFVNLFCENFWYTFGLSKHPTFQNS